MSVNPYKDMMEQVNPSASLIYNTKSRVHLRMEESTRRAVRPRTGAILIAAALILTLAVTAFAATGNFKLFFDKLTNRADTVEQYDYYSLLETWKEENPDADLSEYFGPNYEVTEYTLSFSHYDEIRDLFSINIGNVYMDATEEPGRLWLRTDTKTVVITSSFALGGGNFNAEIFVPLVTDDSWDVAYADYAAADPDKRFIYENESNGIAARVVLDGSLSPEWGMNLRFVYDGAYYTIKGGGLADDASLSPEEIVAMFIDAFEIRALA